MINDLNFALMIHERRRTSEIVVSKKVLLQVLNQMNGHSLHGTACLNMKQASFSYPFLHRVWWRGILFIHVSKDELIVA